MKHRSPVGTLSLTPILTLMAVLGLARPPTAAGNNIDRDLYAVLLEQYTATTQDVVGTRVDYRRLKNSPQWQKLLFQLGRARPDKLATQEDRIAFWINAYNILAIDTVLQNYPVDSIKDAGSLLSPVWDKPAGRVNASTVTLGEIEHKILRSMGEPRIHAAIVCASTSCPSLARAPYEGAQLSAQLDVSVARWLASPAKGVRVDREQNRVTLSKIFDWFEDDFAAGGGVLAFIAPYLDAETRDWLQGAGKTASLDYFDYDWSLNDAAGAAKSEVGG